jgi:hypothetical protein
MQIKIIHTDHIILKEKAEHKNHNSSVKALVGYVRFITGSHVVMFEI